jgi:hypothetical protein
MRVGRLSHVKEKFILNLTNPDDPSHWAYKYFIMSKSLLKHVYYSKTEDNPFLPESYIRQLEETLDPKMVRRMIHGEWIEIKGDVVYYSYDREHNYIEQPYKIDKQAPIRLGFDFNIGTGKPLSSVAAQHNGDDFNVFAETIVEGARTEQVMDEWADKGILDFDTEFVIYGDSTGRRRDTRSNHSDWDLIKNFLDRYRTPDGRPIRYRLNVPLTNPKVRDRHNIVNGQLHSSTGIRRVKLYDSWVTKDGSKKPGARITDEGLRLTKLKPGAQYQEDDSKYYQHCTTALGYLICSTLSETNSKPISSLAR